MKTIKRELFLCAALTAFVFVCALAWGSPFLSSGSGTAAAHAEHQIAHSVLIQGTVVRDGAQFLLRDISGQVYQLDDARQLQSFEGKAVTVTGKLDPQSMMIHVESVDSATV